MIWKMLGFLVFLVFFSIIGLRDPNEGWVWVIAYTLARLAVEFYRQVKRNQFHDADARFAETEWCSEVPPRDEGRDPYVGEEAPSVL